MADLLLVDDDAEYCDSFADILRAHGHTVRCAADGGAGLAQLEERFPDLVLVDIDMPVLTGPDMAWHMFLQNLGKERIPIFFLSANFDLVTIAARCGTPYYLAKPFDLAAVFLVLERALAERIAPAWPER